MKNLELKTTFQMIGEIPEKFKNELLHKLVSGKIEKHPLPWKTERDWGTNVLDSNGKEVFHCLRNVDFAEFLVEFSKRFHVQDVIEHNEILKEAGGDELLKEQGLPVPNYENQPSA